MSDELATAVARGSLQHFDYVAARIEGDKAVRRAQRETMYSHAFRVAIQRNNLQMIKRIHDLHPKPILLAVGTDRPGELLSTTCWLFKYGSLETIQWVIDHRNDRSCCPRGSKNLCCHCLYEALSCLGERDASRVVMWLLEIGSFAKLDKLTTGQSWQNLPEFRHAMARSVELVQLIDKREHLDESTLRSLLLHAVYNLRSSVAMYLLDLIKREMTRRSRRFWQLTPRRTKRGSVSPPELANAVHCFTLAVCGGLGDVVGKMLKEGYCDEFKKNFRLVWSRERASVVLQWDRQFMEELLIGDKVSLATAYSRAASRFRNLDALKWLYYERRVSPDVECLREKLQGDDSHLHRTVALVQIERWMEEIGMSVSITAVTRIHVN